MTRPQLSEENRKLLKEAMLKSQSEEKPAKPKREKLLFNPDLQHPNRKKLTKKQNHLMTTLTNDLRIDLSGGAYQIKRNVIGVCDERFKDLFTSRLAMQIERYGLQYGKFTIDGGGCCAIAIVMNKEDK
jgi:hypothetical protein